MNDNRSGQEQWSAMMDRLTELSRENLSSRQIAVKLSEEFQFNVTRGAVMGKLHRSGLRPSGVNGPGPPRGIQKTYVRKRSPAPRVKPQQPQQRQQGVHILDLRPHHCRWMPGPAASLLYCGEDTRGLSSWCPEHMRMVYGKSSVRS